MHNKSIHIVCVLVLALVLAAAATVRADGSKPCPWKISAIEAGKWANGNNKAGLWTRGSFPIPPGVSERPVWYVNGINVGHSQINFGKRFLPNSSHLLKPGENIIRVQFLRPPYNGAYHQITIQGFEWDTVPNGGYKSFK